MPFETATIGGTFHAMHIGHKQYIEIAFGIAHWVYIHITADAFARSLKRYEVKPYHVRRTQVEQFLKEAKWEHRAEVRSLDSEEQLQVFCLTADLSVAVVEPRYLDLFRGFNAARRERGLDDFYILLKPRTRVGGGREISSEALENEFFD